MPSLLIHIWYTLYTFDTPHTPLDTPNIFLYTRYIWLIHLMHMIFFDSLDIFWYTPETLLISGWYTVDTFSILHLYNWLIKCTWYAWSPTYILNILLIYTCKLDSYTWQWFTLLIWFNNIMLIYLIMIHWVKSFIYLIILLWTE